MKRKLLYRHLRLTGEEADAVKRYSVITEQLEIADKDSQVGNELAKERVRLERNYSLEELSAIEAQQERKTAMTSPSRWRRSDKK